MQRIESPSINSIMVTHPYKRIPYDICPRDEIAAPSKLIAVAQKKDHEWDEIIVHGHKYQRTWVQMRIPFPSVSLKIRSTGFYCATQDPRMFASILDVKDTQSSIFDWLCRYGKTMALITSPQYSYKTKYQEIFYYISNTFPQQTHHCGELTDLTQQMIENNAYTLCNGLTLAIAMQRLGFFSAAAFVYAFNDWMSMQESIYTDITPDIQILVVQHMIPHICDHPYFYAVMGRCKADLRVIQALHASYETYEPFVQQQDDTCQIITSASLQMLPYTPLHIFDYVTQHAIREEEDNDVESTDIKTDLGGLMSALFTQSGIWRRWRKNYKETLTFLRNKSSTTEDFVNHCIRRSFTLYHKGSQVGDVYTNRIRKFWLQLIEVIDPSGVYTRKCIQKHIIHRYVHQELQKRSIYTQIWLPKAPVAFMIEMMRIYGSAWKLFDDQTSISILTSYPEIADIFECTSQRFGDLYSCVVTKPLIEFMGKMKEGSTIHTFYRLMRERAQQRLRIMRSAFMRPTIRNLNENEAYTLWVIMQDYFMDHKESLMA